MFLCIAVVSLLASVLRLRLPSASFISVFSVESPFCCVMVSDWKQAFVPEWCSGFGGRAQGFSMAGLAYRAN